MNQTINLLFHRFIRSKLIGFPEKINMSLSAACQARCIFCPPDRGKKIRRKFMSLETAKKIIDEAKDRDFAGRFAISENGEALLNPEFVRIFDYLRVKRPRNHVRLTTNLEMLDRETSKRILNMDLTELHCNIDGATAETYEFVKKGVSFEKVRTNLHDFLEARKKTGASCVVHMNIISAAKYLKFINGAASRLAEHPSSAPPDDASPGPSRNAPSGPPNEAASGTPENAASRPPNAAPPGLLKAATPDLSHDVASNPTDASAFAPPEDVSPGLYDDAPEIIKYWSPFLRKGDKICNYKSFLRWAVRDKEKKPKANPCSLLARVMLECFIDSSGAMYLCCLDENSMTSYGNVFDSSIEEVWRCARRKKLVEHLITGRFQQIGGPCEFCQD